MSDSETLLDTPKKRNLQSKLSELRADLKKFERNFTETHGKKPKQDDIKNDKTVAAKYKRYHRLQDVLAGRIKFEELVENPAHRRSQREQKSHKNLDGQQDGTQTPRRPRRRLEPGTPSFISPKLILTDAIGPTPHRDGKVLGLFDLLQGSGSAKTTGSPSSSARKRKIDELYSDTPVQRSPLKSIQPQCQRSNKTDGDLLQFLTGTPQKLQTGYDNTKHSRTPRSDCRKFALSQLFATPSTSRFLYATEDEASKTTPLRSLVLGITPQKEVDGVGLNATPAYLKRSTSFKDRLLSAASSPALKASQKPASSFRPIGPPTLRHFRSSTSNTLVQSDVQNNLQKASQHQADDNVDDEDDWAALRELEQDGQQNGVLVQDNQLNDSLHTTHTTSCMEAGKNDSNIAKYKKKGQKRTTKKSNIKPVIQKAAAAPHFVAADDSEDDNDGQDAGDYENITSTKYQQASAQEDLVELQHLQTTKKIRRATKSDEGYQADATRKKAQGMINPNAQSHMNFRSLKIKNKNTKGKGFGRGKFARGHR